MFQNGSPLAGFSACGGTLLLHGSPRGVFFVTGYSFLWHKKGPGAFWGELPVHKKGYVNVRNLSIVSV